MKMNQLKSILKLCESRGFLNRLESNISKDSINATSIGPTGSLLQANLQSEWLNSMILNKDFEIFTTASDSLQQSFDFIKTLNSDKLSFGLTWSSIKCQKSRNLQLEDNESVNFRDLFTNTLVLNSCIFVNPSASAQLFYQWQRQRRMWWRKFSASPGRYSLTTEDDKGVNIQADFPWGCQTVETLTLSGKVTAGTSSSAIKLSEFKEDNRKKPFKPLVISSECHLSVMLMATLADCYEEKKRPLLRLHRKLAPYKIAFSITTSQKTQDLKNLALHLSKQLKAVQVPTLLLPISHKFTLESQFEQYDQLGIPYTLILNENTLKNGLAHMRCRDTTLREQVHVTKATDYVQQLIKNY